MSYRYPDYLFPDYGEGSSSAAGADGRGSWHDVAWAPSPKLEAGFSTTYSKDTVMTYQNPTTQGGVLPSTADADGQSFSAAVCPGYGVGDQPAYTPNITVPNQDHHRGSGRSSQVDSDRKLEYVKGAPIESYENFIVMDRHPIIVGRQLNDGQELQTSHGQSQSDEPPSAFMQHKFKVSWTRDKQEELRKLWEETDLSLEQIAEALGGTTVKQCKKWIGRLEAKRRPQNRQSGQDGQNE